MKDVGPAKCGAKMFGFERVEIKVNENGAAGTFYQVIVEFKGETMKSSWHTTDVWDALDECERSPLGMKANPEGCLHLRDFHKKRMQKIVDKYSQHM